MEAVYSSEALLVDVTFQKIVLFMVSQIIERLKLELHPIRARASYRPVGLAL
jgi:hypothetical protein